MMRMLAAMAAGLMLVFAAQAEIEAKWIENKVTIDAAGVTLHGSYIAMGSWKPDFDAVMFISGSGPTDRDCNQAQMHTDCIKKIADQLAEDGIASLRFDKRMVGASYAPGMKEEDLRFDTFINDAKLWLAFLKSQPGVHRVFVIGHSEGALVGAVVSESDDVSGYVSLEGAGERASDLLRRQIKAGPNGEAVLKLAEPTIQKLEHGELDPSPNVLLATFFRASVQPYLISWFKFDPTAEIKKVPGRVLIVQGSHDLQVTEDQGNLLHAARADAPYALIPDMNHVLRVAPMDRAANFATYNDPTLPLAPGLMEALESFLKAP